MANAFKVLGWVFLPLAVYAIVAILAFWTSGPLSGMGLPAAKVPLYLFYTLVALAVVGATVAFFVLGRRRPAVH